LERNVIKIVYSSVSFVRLINLRPIENQPKTLHLVLIYDFQDRWRFVNPVFGPRLCAVVCCTAGVTEEKNIVMINEKAAWEK
jgi:hypothetical protein